MRKITNGPLLVCLGLAIAGILFFWFSRDVVAEGQAGDEEHSWGYRVSRYQFRRSGGQIETGTRADFALLISSRRR